MPKKAGFWVDLAEYQFDESVDTTWIHAMPLGNYSHPMYGEVNITPERVKNFADSVANKVRGQDLDIDYDHKVKIDHAAGWVKAAEARADGLWFQVQWTPSALKALHDREYRYFSPEFQDEWQHPLTNAIHKDVIFGGGLTNRPYMKGILPINMSELDFVPADKPEGSDAVFGDKKNDFIKKFGLKDDASDEDVLTAISNAQLATTEPPKPDNTQLSELQKQIEEVKKLSETNASMKPMVAMLEAQQTAMETMQKQFDEQSAALRLSEIDNRVKQFSEKATAKGWAVPPAVTEEIKKFFSETNSKKFSDSASEIFNKLLDAKLVQLGEIKTRRTTDGSSLDLGDATKKLSEGVKKIMEDNKNMTYAEAMERYASENREDYDEYRKASYVPQGGE